MRRNFLILSGFALPLAHFAALLLHGWTVTLAYRTPGPLAGALSGGLPTAISGLPAALLTLLLPGIAEMFWGVKIALETGRWAGFPLLAISYPIAYIAFIYWIRGAMRPRL